MPEPRRREQVLDDISQQLEVVTVLSIAILHLLDNSVSLLLLRLGAHFSTPPSRPQIAPALLVALISFAVHLVSSAPYPSDGSSYGYLHGSLIVDFVGQLGPVSKWRLVIFDIMIFSIQMSMITLSFEREKLNQNPAAESDVEAAIPLAPQINDMVATDPEGFERSSTEHPSDQFYTSDYVVINLDILKSLKELAASPRVVPSTSIDDTGAVVSLLSRVMRRP